MTVNIANINLGSGPDTNTGEPLRSAFTKVNNNLSNLKSAVESISTVVTTGNLTIDGQTITGTLNNTDIILDPIGTGKVTVAGDLVTSNLRFIGNTISTQYAGDLVLNASAGRVRFADPIVFPDGTVQYSAAVAAGGTVSQFTINNLESTSANIDTASITSLSGQSATYEVYNWANGNPILSNIATVAFTGSYTDLDSIPSIPSKVSDLTNDTGFVTGDYITWGNITGRPLNLSDFSNDTGFITSDALYWNNIQERPTAVSEFTNDTGFITSSAIPTVLSAFTNDTNFANTSYVDDRITNLIGGAPTALDTLKEIADSMANNTSLASSLTSLIGTKANANAAVSTFTNDVGYITSSTANVISVNGQTGAVVLDLNTYGDSDVATYLSNYNGTINFVGSPAIISGVGTFSTTTANVSGNVNTTGNVSAAFFIGNGSQLTGLPASYTNSNVVSLLSAFGSNTITTTGNITAGNISGNISITGNVTGTSANVTLVAGPHSSTFDTSGNLSVPGNVVVADTLIATDVSLSGGEWIGYAPTWTAQTTAPNIGDGIIEGRYKKIGKTVHVWIHVAMGSTTTFGSGEYKISLPVPARAIDTVFLNLMMRDFGTRLYNSLAHNSYSNFAITNDAVTLFWDAGVVTHNTPFTWADGDYFTISGTYEAE